jgi:hypothetical protein
MRSNRWSLMPLSGTKLTCRDLRFESAYQALADAQLNSSDLAKPFCGPAINA